MEQPEQFKCSGTALQSFIARYASPHMIGVDFDIESGQSTADVQNLVNAAALAQTKYPGLRFSFTLATLAASDGSFGGLNSTGDATVKAIKASSLTNYTVNLMTMDFGRATTANCVLSGSTCQMGQSTIQAVTNLQHTYGTPASKIEVTPMLGVNDASDEVFTLADADTVSVVRQVARTRRGAHLVARPRHPLRQPDQHRVGHVQLGLRHGCPGLDRPVPGRPAVVVTP